MPASDLFGKIALRKGLLNEDQLYRVLRFQEEVRSLGLAKPLGEICLIGRQRIHQRRAARVGPGGRSQGELPPNPGRDHGSRRRADRQHGARDRAGADEPCPVRRRGRPRARGRRVQDRPPGQADRRRRGARTRPRAARGGHAVRGRGPARRSGAGARVGPLPARAAGADDPSPAGRRAGRAWDPRPGGRGHPAHGGPRLTAREALDPGLRAPGRDGRRGDQHRAARPACADRPRGGDQAHPRRPRRDGRRGPDRRGQGDRAPAPPAHRRAV